MLHGREMVLPSMQSLRAKLSPEIRETFHAPRLENLKSKLRTAYKLTRDHGCKSHAANKRYYDRSAKEREFAVGDFVYLYNPAIKVGVSAKFRRPCVGPWRVTKRRSREAVVHVNRLERAYNPVDWQVTMPRKSEMCARNVVNRMRRKTKKYLLQARYQFVCHRLKTLRQSFEVQSEIGNFLKKQCHFMRLN
jgi:hypothetical protein